ncbi:MAG: GNAT family N-acetyltransferase [Candidatus Thiodiazotropha sp. (ex Codakia rugifera)]|nr:GNAT family N-acetyltransferase [Candidatus Thiodiazotropha sp. (ex Codakia rugifera)]
MDLQIEINGHIVKEEVMEIYQAIGWSSAEKPDKLIPALLNSDTLVTARIKGKLVGIGNAISDGHLVVYYPHMLVHPTYQGQGIGHKMMKILLSIYNNFHQQMLTADGKAVEFYKKMGFEHAGNTEPMWIYAGKEH